MRHTIHRKNKQTYRNHVIDKRSPVTIQSPDISEAYYVSGNKGRVQNYKINSAYYSVNKQPYKIVELTDV